LHLTVAFLGRASEAAALEAWDAFVWPLGATRVSLDAVVALGNPRRPSALSALLGRGHDVVARAIGDSREAPIRAARAAADERPPKPHVTLARIGASARPNERRHALAWAAAIDLAGPEVVLDRVALYASKTGPEGRRYTRLRELSLSPSP
jgi:2'-5' RNA ligase